MHSAMNHGSEPHIVLGLLHAACLAGWYGVGQGTRARGIKCDKHDILITPECMQSTCGGARTSAKLQHFPRAALY